MIYINNEVKNPFVPSTRYGYHIITDIPSKIVEQGFDRSSRYHLTFAITPHSAPPNLVVGRMILTARSKKK